MAADSAGEVVDLIGSIYDSILEPDNWRGTLSQFCDLLDARAASIHFLNPSLGRIDLLIEHGTDPEWTQKLLSTYAGMSPIGAAVMIAEVGEPVTAFDFVDEAEYVGSRFYREWCEPQGYYDMMGTLLSKSADSIGAVSATRLRDRQRFGQPERELLRKLSPHFRRATAIAGLLGYRSARIDGLETVVEHLASAVVLIDATRRIAHTNRSAQRLLDEGRIVQSLAGRLTMTDPGAHRALQDALAADGSIPVAITLTVDDGSKRTAVVLRSGPGADNFAVLLHEPRVDAPVVGRHLMTLFGLTPREVAVLMPLLAGSGPEEIANALGVSLPTVRSHLARLYAKTGTERQADLVRVIMQAMPPVRTD